jgi:hypothetical protein
MITKTKQNWQPGSIVKVGFLKLRVLSARAEYDGRPDIYTLESIDGAKRYEFIPHNGLTLISDKTQENKAGADRLNYQWEQWRQNR